MIEYLLIPVYQGSSRSLEDWVALLERLGQQVDLARDGRDGAALSLEPLGASGYAEIEADGSVSALHLEFGEGQAETGQSLVESAGAEFGWEVIAPDDDDSVEDD